MRAGKTKNQLGDSWLLQNSGKTLSEHSEVGLFLIPHPIPGTEVPSHVLEITIPSAIPIGLRSILLSVAALQTHATGPPGSRGWLCA